VKEKQERNNRGKTKQWLYPVAAIIAVVAVTGAALSATHLRNAAEAQTAAAGNINNANTTANGVVDPGSSLDGRPAPQFTLTDQFGKQVSLSQFKGKVVILAFVDSECTTICPLTTESMMRALQMLGPKAASDVQLLGVNANPQATSVSDVMTYSKNHNMVNSWHFLTGSVDQLKSLWKNYYIYDQIVKGQIDHTPALYIIGPNGKEQYLFMTPSQYAAVDAQASVLAQQVAKFLPASAKPQLKSVTYHAPTVGPDIQTALPLANGQGHAHIGPGHPQLLVYFSSWAPNVEENLKALDQYAATKGAPDTFAIDVLPTEPNNQPNERLLKAVSPKHYQIALDKTGDVTDAYQVTDLMWITLTDGRGHIIWSHDGWLPIQTLKKTVQSQLQKANG
jgi:cytochrome oxidase Cu insertion factor (SCO1/SenC/PrrC family)